MKLKRYRSKISFKLDATPMTDVVFLLLIFFMLSSSFLIDRGINVKLPKTEISEDQLQTKLLLTITKDNRIFLNNKQVSMKKLPFQLKTALARQKEKMLIIKADKDVRHGTVVEIMDIAKINGVQKLAIATEIKKK